MADYHETQSLPEIDYLEYILMLIGAARVFVGFVMHFCIRQEDKTEKKGIINFNKSTSDHSKIR